MLKAQPLMARVTNKPNLGKKNNPNGSASEEVPYFSKLFVRLAGVDLSVQLS